MKIEMGIGWVPDEDQPGGLRSATPGEYAAEIERLRATLRDIIRFDTSVIEGDHDKPVTWTGMSAGLAIKALGGISREEHLALGRAPKTASTTA